MPAQNHVATKPKALNVVGLQLTPLVEEPGAQYEVFLQEGGEGVGPGWHSHPWDESFYVLSGEVTFGLGDESSVARQGDVVHVPANASHWFKLGADGARMISVSGGDHHSKLFREMDSVDLDMSDTSPENIARMADMATRHGITLGHE